MPTTFETPADATTRASFHSLPIVAVDSDAGGAARVLTFEVPPASRERFRFRPGQFVTLRAHLADVGEQRRSYSICSAPHRYDADGRFQVGIKAVDGGRFSGWVIRHSKVGERIDVMPPDGRFVPRTADAGDGLAHAPHRVGFAAGSGITPVLSIARATLADPAGGRFTLVYGNRRVDTAMFHEALQDLKDRHPARFSLMHVLSRQPQEAALFNGRVDETKVRELLRALIDPRGIDEAFVCGPAGMIDDTVRALVAAGVDAARVHAERFVAAPGAASVNSANAIKSIATEAHIPWALGQNSSKTSLRIVLDGKTHALSLAEGQHVLDAGLAAGLDLPWSCKGGVCCTCRAKVIDGQVTMDRNYTLEPREVGQGFVLTCQARAVTSVLTISFDER